MPTSDDDEVALKLSKQLKKGRNSSSKQNIRQAGPLRRTQAKDSSTAATHKQWLQQCQQLYDSLPKNSQWAKHKRKVVSKAIQILSKAEAERTAAEAIELQKLLGTLKIGAPRSNTAPSTTAAAAAQAHGQATPAAAAAAAAATAATAAAAAAGGLSIADGSHAMQE